MNSNLIAINITYKDDRGHNILIKENCCPLLFFQDNIDNVSQDLKDSEDFVNWLISNKVFDLSIYTVATLNYLSISKDEDDWIEVRIPIQELFPLEWLFEHTDEKNEINKEIFGYLYEKSFGSCYDFNKFKMFENDICNRIKIEYGDKMTNEVFMRGISDYIEEKYPHLSKENFEFILKECKEIIYK